MKLLKSIIQKNSQRKTRVLFGAKKPSTISKISSSIPSSHTDLSTSIPSNSSPFILDSLSNVEMVIECTEDVLKISNISNSLLIV